MSSNGSANVKHSEAMSDEIITAMSTACGASIFLLESICCPSYEMTTGSLTSMGFNNMMHAIIINYYKLL